MRLTTEKTIRGRWSREDLALYAILAGGAVIFGIVIVMVVRAYEPPLEEGRVIEQRFTQEHWEDGYRTEHYADCGFHLNFDGEMEYSCEPATRRVYEEHHEWVPDDYDIKLHACKLDDEGKEKCRSSWKDVPAHIYVECKIGSLYKKELASCRPQ